MAFKQLIPEQWIKQRPALQNFSPYFYNLDGAVGLGCPNKRSDVLLIQYLLMTWGREKPLGGGERTCIFLHLPTTGTFDNRLLGWILYYQLYFWETNSAAITGKVEPIRDLASLNIHNMLVHLNVGFGIPIGNSSAQSNLRIDLASDPGVPPELAHALMRVR